MSEKRDHKFAFWKKKAPKEKAAQKKEKDTDSQNPLQPVFLSFRFQDPFISIQTDPQTKQNTTRSNPFPNSNVSSSSLSGKQKPKQNHKQNENRASHRGVVVDAVLPQQRRRWQQSRSVASSFGEQTLPFIGEGSSQTLSRLVPLVFPFPLFHFPSPPPIRNKKTKEFPPILEGFQTKNRIGRMKWIQRADMPHPTSYGSSCVGRNHSCLWRIAE